MNACCFRVDLQRAIGQRQSISREKEKLCSLHGWVALRPTHTYQSNLKKVVLTKDEWSNVLLPIMSSVNSLMFELTHRGYSWNCHAQACVKKNKPTLLIIFMQHVLNPKWLNKQGWFSNVPKWHIRPFSKTICRISFEKYNDIYDYSPKRRVLASTSPVTGVLDLRSVRLSHVT